LSNILVAEDNLLNQRLIQHVLQELGHRVTIVGDGSAALARIEMQEFDMVLMDLHMPGLSGLEAVRLLRAREQEDGGHLAVIALTAQAVSGDAERCRHAGMDGYLTKPLDIEELERVITRVQGTSAPRTVPPDDGLPYRRAVLEHRVGSDPAFLLELSGIFEARADLLIAQIQRAIEAHHSEGVKDAAHELKGMLLNLAATDAYRTVRELEAAGRSARYETASACLARLLQEAPRLLSALRARAGSTRQSLDAG